MRITPEEAPAGEAVTITVRLANTGEVTAAKVIVAGLLPDGLEPSPRQGVSDPASRRLLWEIGAMVGGAERSFTFTARVGEAAAWNGGVSLRLRAAGQGVSRAT